MFTGIILCMRPANERQRYNVTLSLIGWVHAQNDNDISFDSHYLKMAMHMGIYGFTQHRVISSAVVLNH